MLHAALQTEVLGKEEALQEILGRHEEIRVQAQKSHRVGTLEQEEEPPSDGLKASSQGTTHKNS